MRVNLTWVDGKGRETTEEVKLLSEDLDVIAFGDQEAPGLLEKMESDGWVMFQDDTGVFGLRPEQVKNIERIEEGGE